MNSHGADDIERVAKAAGNDGFTFGTLSGERGGEDGKFVVGLDEAQLLDESIVAHIGCAGKLVASL